MATESGARPYYYVDGFHGGIDGHMPLGTLRDLLDGLEQNPAWKVSLEIEPYSWPVVQSNDPASIERLRALLADSSAGGRVEFVSPMYAQPYAWNVGGESLIRHLQYGLDELAAVFPGVPVDTYAVQEPCWSSCLPQLLVSFGFKRAALPNSTCWVGYHATMLDADLVHWTSPNWTSIPTAPRYACDPLVGAATEGNAAVPEGYIDKCYAAGIGHPVGTILQDAGWPGRPWDPAVEGKWAGAKASLTHVTWREYVDTIAEKPSHTWHASQEDYRVGLAWGASIVQRMGQVIRDGENRVTHIEKLATLVAARNAAKSPGRLANYTYPADTLRTLWTDLLLGQHHDCWIVPYNNNRSGTWASECDARHAAGSQACRELTRVALAALAPTGALPVSADRLHARLVNTSSFKRPGEVVGVEVTSDRGTQDFIVRDNAGRVVPSQTVARRRYPDKSISAATVLLRTDLPAMGYTTCTIEPVKSTAEGSPTDARINVTTAADGDVTIDTGLYRLTFDAARGGTIRSLLHKPMSHEFVDGKHVRRFNEYRGYFGDAWLSSADAAAVIKVVESGPLRAVVRVEGKIGPHAFITTYTFLFDQPGIDCRVQLAFPTDGGPYKQAPKPQFRLGEPWPEGKEVLKADRRPLYDSRYKLQALFPTTLKQQTIDKNCAFDVCRSQLADTTFDRWSQSKHNVVVNWIDIGGQADRDGNAEKSEAEAADRAAGLAVLVDHTTAYSHGVPGEPTGLVLCYSGRGNWYDFTLGRQPDVRYALIPHAGDWAAAGLWREQTVWAEPVVSRIIPEPAEQDRTWSLFDATAPGLDSPAAFIQDGHVHVRLFNAGAKDEPAVLSVPDGVQAIDFVELDGRLRETVKVENGKITLRLPRFAVWTLRWPLATA